MLLALRADASIKDKRGRTASDVARRLSHLQVCVCVCVCVYVCVCVRARAYGEASEVKHATAVSKPPCTQAGCLA